MKEGDVSHASTWSDTIEHDPAPGLEVLVVDDDDDLRRVIGDVLRDDGLSVVEASNGSAALDYLLGACTMPSLILLDLNMPIMSGREVIRVLQGYLRFSSIPVLVITSEVLLRDSSQEGTVGRLQKPFSGRDLLLRVRQHARPAW